MTKPDVKTFFDEATNTASHIILDPLTDACAIVDSVLGFDAASGRTDPTVPNQLIDYITANKKILSWILETHIHADHLSAAPYLKSKLGGKIAIGAHIADVQKAFKDIFNVERIFPADGSQFDRVFDDCDTFNIGNLTVHAMHTPGHTPACMSYLVGDAVFVGDTLFMPDYGTARCDFPGGDAVALYRSIQKLFALPDETRVFLCHDYKAPGRDRFEWETTIGEEKSSNIHVGGEVGENAFVALRTERDKTLNMPKLILPSVQINMRAGQFPPQEENGISYVKIPLDAL